MLIDNILYIKLNDNLKETNRINLVMSSLKDLSQDLIDLQHNTKIVDEFIEILEVKKTIIKQENISFISM